MNSIEKRTTIVIAIIVSLRMYGLFLIMPVFSVVGQNYIDSTPFLIGVAIGAYGLTQALLQIPLGLLSDLWGRKKVMILGLGFFLFGSLIAALSETIYGVIFGRFVQGLGAIASTGMALVADVSRPEQRTKMMAIVGSSIGLAFVLAFITSPSLLEIQGPSGLFWFTSILAFLSLLLLIFLINEPNHSRSKSIVLSEVFNSLKKKELLALNVSVFALHAALSSVFVLIPLILFEVFNFPVVNHWKIYLPVLFVSVVFLIPMIMLYEKKKNYLFFISVELVLMSLSIALFSLHESLWLLIGNLVGFFAVFNFLESAMPSLLSRIAGEKYRGSAMGAYSSSQFLGAFVGATISGYLLSFGKSKVFLFVAAGIFVVGVFAFICSKNSSSEISKEI